MEGTLVWLRQLSCLRMLALEGNPLVLTRDYAKVIQERVPGLKVLDGNTVFAEHDENQNDKKSLTLGKTASLKRGARSTSTTSLEEFTYPVVQNCSIDLQLRVLKNLEGGRYLIPGENCDLEPEALDEVPEERKSSQYWLTFTDHQGMEVCTEKRTYIRHF